ncbi:MAG: Uma2 family endonuclease [Caldilineaceae bacterium]|nr:Uma2 family endonuclease [Caldilineaceae bacterium]
MTQVPPATATGTAAATPIAPDSDGTTRTLPVKRYRLADLSDFPTEDGYRYEIIDGELIVTPAPARRHAALAVRLTRLLSQALDKQQPGWCLITQPFVLETETETTTHHCEPDLGIFAQPLETFVSDEELLPAIVIEIVSPGNPENDYVRKVTAYAAIGIPEYWIVDSRHRTITFLALTTTGQQRHYAKIEHSQLLPETELALDEIFAGL